jgi:hypothetical protein
MSTTVYVGNVESTVDEFTLKSIFENCGAVIGVRLAGCVFVSYFLPASARAGGVGHAGWPAPPPASPCPSPRLCPRSGGATPTRRCRWPGLSLGGSGQGCAPEHGPVWAAANAKQREGGARARPAPLRGRHGPSLARVRGPRLHTHSHTLAFPTHTHPIPPTASPATTPCTASSSTRTHSAFGFGIGG